MAHWPRTAAGNIFYIAMIAIMVPVAVWLLVSASWWVLALLALVPVVWIMVYAWRRRLDAARERAWVGEFSFGDVVGRMRAREALDRPRVSQPVADAR